MLVDDVESQSTTEQLHQLSPSPSSPSSLSAHFILAPPVASLFTAALSAHFQRLSPSSLFVHLHSVQRLTRGASPAPLPPPPSVALYRWTRSSPQSATASVDFVAACGHDERVDVELLSEVMAALSLSSMLLALVDPALSVTIMRLHPSIRPHHHQQQQQQQHRAHDSQPQSSARRSI